MLIVGSFISSVLIFFVVHASESLLDVIHTLMSYPVFDSSPVILHLLPLIVVLLFSINSAFPPSILLLA